MWPGKKKGRRKDKGRKWQVKHGTWGQNDKIKQETCKIKNSNHVITEDVNSGGLTSQRCVVADSSASPQTASVCAAFTDRALIGSLVSFFFSFSNPFLLICSSVVINYHSACWSSNGIRINAGRAVFLNRFSLRNTHLSLQQVFSLKRFANLQPEESGTTKMNRMYLVMTVNRQYHGRGYQLLDHTKFWCYDGAETKVSPSFTL